MAESAAAHRHSDQAVALMAGFDAGQTHTTCRLARLETSGSIAVVAEGEGPGVRHLAAPEGPRYFMDALKGSLAAARGPAGASTALVAAAVGASGIEQGTSLQGDARQLLAAALDLAPEMVLATGDERTALRGALGDAAAPPHGGGGEAGIVVISGTGCICVGRNGSGQERRAGGWGWLLDGAGSAMDIGRDGLALSLRMADGRCTETPLRQALWQALGVAREAVDGPQWIKARVVQPNFGAAGFAALAPVVHQQAWAGDPKALAILEHSAAALVEMVGAVAAGLALVDPPVVGLGGALEHLPLLRNGFQRGLAEAGITRQLRAPLGDGADGALAMARDLVAFSRC